MDCNVLSEQLHNRTQALVHFIEHGWRERLPLGPGREFDLEYYSELAGKPLAPPEEAYRLWVELGFADGAMANPAEHLRSLALDPTCYPDGFDWHTYLDERPDVCSAARSKGRPPNRWDALEHLMEYGVRDGGPPLPICADALPGILLAAADRFAIAKRQEDAVHTYDRALLYPNAPIRLLQHAADQAMRQQHHAQRSPCIVAYGRQVSLRSGLGATARRRLRPLENWRRRWSGYWPASPNIPAISSWITY